MFQKQWGIRIFKLKCLAHHDLHFYGDSRKNKNLSVFMSQMKSTSGTKWVEINVAMWGM